MRTTVAIQRLDEIHSILVQLVSQDQTSVVIQTIASVMTQIPALDKASNDSHYWQAVICNLNVLADTLQAEELRGESLFDSELEDSDWMLAEQLLDEDFTDEP